MVIVKSVRHSLLLAVPASLALCVAVALIPLVFGSAFSEAVGPGLVLIPGVAALGVASVLNANLLGAGHARYSLYVSLIATPITLALYIVLIPEYEIWGAAVASTVSYLLSTVVAYVFFQRATEAPGLRELLPRREDLDDYRQLAARVRRRGRPPERPPRPPGRSP